MKDSGRKNWLYLTPVIILSVILRYWNLSAIALWHDEAFSVLMPEYPVSEMLARLALDVHPPLYYLLYYGWKEIFGNTVFDLRMFSVFFGILGLIGIYLLVRKTFEDNKLALWAIFLSAVNPFLILYAQEGRMYALGLFLAIFANYFLIKAIRRKQISDWFFFIVFASAATYTHYYLLFSVFAMMLFIAYKAVADREQRSYFIRSFLTSGAFLVLLYLPWLRQFFDQLSQVQENYWIPEMTLWSVPNTLINLLTGGVVSIGESNWWLGVIFIGLILFLFIRGLGYLKKRSTEGMVLIILNFLTPFILAILLSFKQSLYLDRYFIFIVPFYLIVLTAGIYSLKPKNLRRAIMLIFAAVMAFSYINYWQTSNINQKPGMRGASTYLNNSYGEDDKILVTSSFVYFTFKHYNQTGQEPILYAPGELSHFSGTALLDEDDIAKNFEKFGEEGDTIWLISTSGFGNFRPELPSDWHKLSEQEYPDSNSVKGSIFIEKYQIFSEDLTGMIKYMGE